MKQSMKSPKSKKLKISTLKVSSFVTLIDTPKSATARGGFDQLGFFGQGSVANACDSFPVYCTQEVVDMTVLASKTTNC